MSLFITSGTITALFKLTYEVFINIKIIEEVSGNPLTTGPYCTATYKNSSIDNSKTFTKNGTSYTASVSENGSVSILLPSGTVWGSSNKQYRCLGVYYNGNSILPSFNVSSLFNISDTGDRILIVKYEEI